MNWFDHEYLVPVIIGNGKCERSIAAMIRRSCGAIPYIFAERFGFGQRFTIACRKVKPMNAHTLLIDLCDFSDSLEEYKFPVLIYGNDNMDFVSANAETLEERFVLCDISRANELLNGADNNEDK